MQGNFQIFFKNYRRKQLIDGRLSNFLKYFVRFFLYQFVRAQTHSEGKIREIWSKAKVCCVASASGIGDSLMATPMIEQIKRCKPEIKLIVVSIKRTTPVFVHNPNVDKIIQYDHNFDSIKFNSIIPFILMLLKIRRENIDIFLAAQPFNVIRHSLIAAFSKAKMKLKHTYVYGTSTERDYSFIYHKLLPDNMARHRVELNLDFLRFMGEKIGEKSTFPRFHIRGVTNKHIDEMLIKDIFENRLNKIIAVHAGGGRANKRWPPNSFAEVIKALINKGFPVYLVGGYDEKILNNQIFNQIGVEEVFNVAGIFSLEETAALLKRCKCLITNDSGIMHLSTAVDVPVLSIFGPTDFRRIGPYSKKARVIFKSDDIQSVTPKDILVEIGDILNADFG